MEVLIDTQVLIWIQENNPALSATSRTVLSDSVNRIFVSQISFFEVAIKLKVGKLPDFRVSVSELIDQTRRDGIRTLRLDEYYIATYEQIPFYADHRDPFDRLILATALAEKMPFISADEKFGRYRDVEIIW